jgi:hypothetical protein
MSLTISQVYSVRFGVKLPLPRGVQDNIARLRITPVTYKPFRPAAKQAFRPRQEPSIENWRVKSLTAYVSKINDKADKEYSEIMAILNKLSLQKIDPLTKEALAIMATRDAEFRLRVSALLFDKAITESMFASLMADFALRLVVTIPDVREDLTTQLAMFPKLYNTTDTLTYPVSSEPGYDDKVVLWMKQKDKRRGYAKFVTQLFVRELVSEEFMSKTIESVISDLHESAAQVKTEQTEENTTQYVDFLFESAKVLPRTAKALNARIKEDILAILGSPKPSLPSLCMRSRFRIEDTLKCVQ